MNDELERVWQEEVKARLKKAKNNISQGSQISS
jgi:hypothetical protein